MYSWSFFFFTAMFRRLWGTSRLWELGALSIGGGKITRTCTWAVVVTVMEI
jgi:hypothetical protein